MKQITTPDEPVAPPHGESARHAADRATEAMQTPTLLALRELLDASSRVRPTVARRAGLSHSELVALEQLSTGPRGPGEVARRLDVTTAAATGIVDRLVARGHAERRPDTHDRRRTSVRITDSGRAEVLAHLMPMFAELARIDAPLTDSERVVVERYLRGATRALRAVLDPEAVD